MITWHRPVLPITLMLHRKDTPFYQVTIFQFKTALDRPTLLWHDSGLETWQQVWMAANLFQSLGLTDSEQASLSFCNWIIIIVSQRLIRSFMCLVAPCLEKATPIHLGCLAECDGGRGLASHQYRENKPRPSITLCRANANQHRDEWSDRCCEAKLLHLVFLWLWSSL